MQTAGAVRCMVIKVVNVEMVIEIDEERSGDDEIKKRIFCQHALVETSVGKNA